MTKRLVLASHNAKKTAELASILQPLGLELLSLADFPDVVAPEEDGDTFDENASIKAVSAFHVTGLPSLADDSGLVVPALGGLPGVRSARFAGENAGDEENKAALLDKMTNMEGDDRRAYFVSVVALAISEKSILTFRGETEGTILRQPIGYSGFGYDPLFLSSDLGVTFAEADAAEKNRVSHRGRALSKLCNYLTINPLY